MLYLDRLFTFGILDDLDFADDIALISSTQQQLNDLDFTDDIAFISSTQQQLDDLDFTDNIALITISLVLLLS
jgi:hypothetical protein